MDEVVPENKTQGDAVLGCPANATTIQPVGGSVPLEQAVATATLLLVMIEASQLTTVGALAALGGSTPTKSIVKTCVVLFGLLAER